MEHTFNPHIPTGGNSEDKQESDEQERFHIVSGNAFCGENHRADKLALGGSKPGPDDNTEATFIRGVDWRRNFRCCDD